mmetsp:Transcript_49969/g.150284  ORF Transcript_49969/g.150284 Transcript_49969/m.150284 type:complete len:203 (+) Transcript_49969:949-1557(+)
MKMFHSSRNGRGRSFRVPFRLSWMRAASSLRSSWPYSFQTSSPSVCARRYISMFSSISSSPSYPARRASNSDRTSSVAPRRRFLSSSLNNGMTANMTAATSIWRVSSRTSITSMANAAMPSEGTTPRASSRFSSALAFWTDFLYSSTLVAGSFLISLEILYCSMYRPALMSFQLFRTLTPLGSFFILYLALSQSVPRKRDTR